MEDKEWKAWQQKQENKWHVYETEKKRLQRVCRSWEEYDAEIQKVIERLQL